MQLVELAALVAKDLVNLGSPWSADGRAFAALAARRGCTLLRYDAGRVASIRLPSREVLLVSLGTTTMRVLSKRPFFGWVIPMTVLSCKLSTFGCGVRQPNPLARHAAACVLLFVTLGLLIRASSIREVGQQYGENLVELLECAIGEVCLNTN